MSVHEETAAELVRLEAAKADIAAYITEKGVEVPEGTALDGFRALLDSIVGGGLPTGIAEMTCGEYVSTYNSTGAVSIQHGLSGAPHLFACRVADGFTESSFTMASYGLYMSASGSLPDTVGVTGNSFTSASVELSFASDNTTQRKQTYSATKTTAFLNSGGTRIVAGVIYKWIAVRFDV